MSVSGTYLLLSASKDAIPSVRNLRHNNAVFLDRRKKQSSYLMAQRNNNPVNWPRINIKKFNLYALEALCFRPRIIIPLFI